MLDRQINLSAEDKQDLEEPTAQYLAKLLFLSFRFSQGNVGFQKGLFRFVKLIHPDWKVGIGMRSEAVEAACTNAINFVVSGNGKNHKRDLRLPYPNRETVLPELEKIALLMDQEVEDEEILIERLTKSVIDRDYSFMIPNEKRRTLMEGGVAPVGRERYRDGRKIESSEGESIMTDPYTSQFREYALKARLTGIWEFDEMFRQMRLFWEENKNCGEWVLEPGSPPHDVIVGKQLNVVRQVWEEKHPGQTFF